MGSTEDEKGRIESAIMAYLTLLPFIEKAPKTTDIPNVKNLLNGKLSKVHLKWSDSTRSKRFTKELRYEPIKGDGNKHMLTYSYTAEYCVWNHYAKWILTLLLLACIWMMLCKSYGCGCNKGNEAPKQGVTQSNVSSKEITKEFVTGQAKAHSVEKIAINHSHVYFSVNQ